MATETSGENVKPHTDDLFITVSQDNGLSNGSQGNVVRLTNASGFNSRSDMSYPSQENIRIPTDDLFSTVT